MELQELNSASEPPTTLFYGVKYPFVGDLATNWFKYTPLRSCEHVALHLWWEPVSKVPIYKLGIPLLQIDLSVITTPGGFHDNRVLHSDLPYLQRRTHRGVAAQGLRLGNRMMLLPMRARKVARSR